MCGAGSKEFIFRVLGFEHGSICLRINPIFESSFFVVGNYAFNISAIIPGEGQVLAVTFEIILNMAVRTNNRTHFLSGKSLPILALAFKGFFKRRVGHDQTHSTGFVTVGTADRFIDVGRHLIERHGIIGFHAQFSPQARVGRGFARIASGRCMLGIFIIQIQTLGCTHIIQRIGMAAIIVVIFAEGIPSKKNHLTRVTFQPRELGRTSIGGIGIIGLGLHQRIILVREVDTP